MNEKIDKTHSFRCMQKVFNPHDKGPRVVRYCKRPRKPGFNFCQLHINKNVTTNPDYIMFGDAHPRVYKLTKQFMRQYSGKEYDQANEIAFLRALLYECSSALLALPPAKMMHHLKFLSEIVDTIGKIAERFTKIDHGLKIKIELGQLQGFVSFVIDVINRTVDDPQERQAISEALGGYIERLETDT